MFSEPADVLLVALAVAFAMLGLRPLGDPDVWWHLRTGELVVEQGFIATDPWSHASSNPWVLHEWATEVLMYLSYAAGGYRGVITLHILGLLALATVLLLSIRRVASPLQTLAIGLLALIGVYLGTAERPQLLSWCLLAATAPALRRAVVSRKAPWWLPVVVLVWANLHGLWAAALALYAAVVVGLIFEVGLGRWRHYRSFIAVGLVSGLAVLANPSGLSLLFTPLHVREYAPFVTEWRPPSLLNPWFAASFILLAVVLVGWARSPRRLPYPEIAFVFGACLLSLPYIRTMPILAITMAPLAAEKLAEWRPARADLPARSRAPQIALAGLLMAVAVAAAAWWLPQVPGLKRGAPFEASAALDALPGRAKVLNEYRLGGWMLWAARDSSPAVDGRTEIYAPDYLARALAAVDGARGWRSFVRSQEIDAAFLSTEAPLATHLTAEGWRPAYRDSDWLVLIPSKP